MRILNSFITPKKELTRRHRVFSNRLLVRETISIHLADILRTRLPLGHVYHARLIVFGRLKLVQYSCAEGPR